MASKRERTHGRHHFGTASFTNELWIKNKAVFSLPIGVDVEFLTAGAFDWVFADSNASEVLLPFSFLQRCAVSGASTPFRRTLSPRIAIVSVDDARAS
jgi:hypothetical protein